MERTRIFYFTADHDDPFHVVLKQEVSIKHGEKIEGRFSADFVEYLSALELEGSDHHVKAFLQEGFHLTNGKVKEKRVDMGLNVFVWKDRVAIQNDENHTGVTPLWSGRLQLSTDAAGFWRTCMAYPPLADDAKKLLRALIYTGYLVLRPQQSALAS